MNKYFLTIIIVIICLLNLGMGIYAGYTADNNKPNDQSSGLFIAAYVLCIIYYASILQIYYR